MELVATLDGCTQWFAGGTKELKATVPAWASVEAQLETLVEYVEVTRSMRALTKTDDTAAAAALPSEIETALRTITSNFRDRQMRWSTVLVNVGFVSRLSNFCFFLALQSFDFIWSPGRNRMRRRGAT